MDKIDIELKNIINYAYNKLPSYRAKMDKVGIAPKDFNNRNDMQFLPFMDKEDFRLGFPYKQFAVPNSQIIRCHSTSGTTGTPSVVGFTKKDLERQKYLTSLIGRMAGLNADDIVQIVYGFGMFTGGIGWLEGLETIGSLVIPTGAGNTKKQIDYLQSFGTTALIGTPSYMIHIAEIMYQMNIDIKKSINVKKILVGGEIMTENMRAILKKNWEVDNVTQNYGFCEGGGAGIAGECLLQNGMHISSDYYPEIIDSNTLENKPLGSEGELVFTTLKKESMPLIRYRTHDISKLYYEKCDCGIEGYKMSSILGRTDDMLKIKGICVFPKKIEEILLNSPVCSPNYMIILETKNYLDFVNIEIELSDFGAARSDEEILYEVNRLKKEIKESLDISVNVIFVSKNTVERFEGKAKRVKDLRLFRRDLYGNS